MKNKAAGALGQGQPAIKSIGDADSIPHSDWKIFCVADLAAVKPYKGALRMVTFGDSNGEHATARLDNLTIELYRGDRQMYWIDLERCLTPAQVLDWIFQVHKKTWMTAELLRTTLEALDCALNPQGSLCSCGLAAEIAQKDLRGLVEVRLRDHIGWHLCDPGSIPLSWRAGR
jgi:hypothetical protein